MTLATKNLGIVKAIHIGNTPPINSNMLWRDTSASPNVFKSFDNLISTWVELSNNISNTDLVQTELQRSYTVFENGLLKFVTDTPNNTTVIQFGENSNERFSNINMHSQTFDKTVAIFDTQNDGIGYVERVNPNEYDIQRRTDISDSLTKTNRIYLTPESSLIEFSTGGKFETRLTQTVIEHRLGHSGGRLSLSETGNTFEDFNTTKRGIQYISDYSADYTNRSLVDKAFVERTNMNYIDISSFISGYTLTSSDAGVLITNSGVNVRSLNIPNGLALPNNTVFVKGRVSITPTTGVTVELPDGSTITNGGQFLCLQETKYVLHRSTFSGDGWILLALGKADWGSIGGTLPDQTDLQNALNDKEPTITVGTSAQYYRGDKTFQTLDKTAVGLTNVDNTSDVNKPVSTAQQTALDLKLNITDAYGGKRYTLIKPNGTKEFYDTLTLVRSNWGDGDVLHQFANETDITYVDNGGGYMYTLPNLHWMGNGFSIKVSNILVSGEAYFLPVGKTAYLSNIKLGGQGANASTVMLVNGTLYADENTFISVDIENNKSSSVCLSLSGTMYGGNVIANGDGEGATLPQGGISGVGTCVNVNTRGFQSGNLTNFVGGSTTYSVATNYRNVYCNFGNQQIGNGKTFDHCYIYSTRNNNGANQSVFVARNCDIIHVPSANTHTFYNIANITMIDCTFISGGYLCATFGSSGTNLIQGGYHSFAGQVNYGAHNYASLLTIADCTIEATNPSATTDVLLLNNSNATNVKISNVTFRNAIGRSDIRTIPANNVSWVNCRFSNNEGYISVSTGAVADVIKNNPARLTKNVDSTGNIGNGLNSPFLKGTTAERTTLSGSLGTFNKGFIFEDVTDGFTYKWNGTAFEVLGGSTAIADAKESYSLSNISGTFTSSNMVNLVKVIVEHGIAVTSIGTLISSGGAGTISLVVYNNALTTKLIQADIVAPTTGINQVAITSTSITQGIYWFGIRNNDGSVTLSKKDTVASSEICRSVFNSSATLPDDLSSATADTVAPYLLISTQTLS